jgi:hypothetical protein
MSHALTQGNGLPPGTVQPPPHRGRPTAGSAASPPLAPRRAGTAAGSPSAPWPARRRTAASPPSTPGRLTAGITAGPRRHRGQSAAGTGPHGPSLSVPRPVPVGTTARPCRYHGPSLSVPRPASRRRSAPPPRPAPLTSAWRTPAPPQFGFNPAVAPSRGTKQAQSPPGQRRRDNSFYRGSMIVRGRRINSETFFNLVILMYYHPNNFRDHLAGADFAYQAISAAVTGRHGTQRQ